MLVVLILHKNICRYHLDKETDLYYLNSRYYDPEIGRFLSADRPDYLEPESINGLNLYRYCANNPVMMNDTEGNAPAWWEWVVSGILIVVGTVLCATFAGSVFGAGLIAAGGSMMASNIMSAIGVDGKVASIISAGLNIVAGVALCFTPLAALGASMIGSGVGSIGGGFLSEALGFGFQAGAMIGAVVVSSRSIVAGDRSRCERNCGFSGRRNRRDGNCVGRSSCSGSRSRCCMQ